MQPRAIFSRGGMPRPPPSPRGSAPDVESCGGTAGGARWQRGGAAGLSIQTGRKSNSDSLHTLSCSAVGSSSVNPMWGRSFEFPDISSKTGILRRLLDQHICILLCGNEPVLTFSYMHGHASFPIPDSRCLAEVQRASAHAASVLVGRRNSRGKVCFGGADASGYR